MIRKGVDAWEAPSGAELILPVQLAALGDAFTQAGRFGDARQAARRGPGNRGEERRAVPGSRAPPASKASCCWQGRPNRPLPQRNASAVPSRSPRKAQRSRAWELRARMSIARLWQRQGGRGEARAALAAVVAAYTEGFTTPDLGEAGSLLEALA